MSAALESVVGKPWKKPPFIKNKFVRWGFYTLSLAYLIFAISTLEPNWGRIMSRGLDRGWEFIVAFSEPDFWSRAKEIKKGIWESVVMTIASTVVGITISVPIALGAAGNIAPKPVYLLCRGIIAVSRALNEIVLAILFVAFFGFGPFAGFLVLSFATIGFLAKLLAEDIEDMNKVQAEAVKATGASWLQWVVYGVQPQVMPRLVGLSMYRLDINFRESAVLGLVGAGGIGGTLATAFSRYEFDNVAAILLIIIGTVLVLEYLSGILRERIK